MRLVWLLLVIVGCERPPTTPSILLVSFDTLRADRVGATRGLTPNLDAFAADSVVFSSAWSQSDLTSMSHASLFTSRYPSELGPVDPGFQLGPTDTLASVLSAYGYETAAFTSGGHLSRNTGLDQGFATFEATEGLGSFWHTVPKALRWLDQRSDEHPFFLFLHSYDAHMPYLKPAPYGLAWADPAYQGPATEVLASPIGTALIFDGTVFHSPRMIGVLEERSRPRTWDLRARLMIREAAENPEMEAEPFGGKDEKQVVDAYDGAVAYADAWFGYLIAALKKRNLYDSVTIVVFSDHGELVGEDGRFGHGDALNDWILQVPLMVHQPGATPRRISSPVALLDVMPTLLESAHATLPAGISGQSLQPWLRGESGPSRPVVFAEGTTRMISARSEVGRLTFAGISADSAYLSPLLEHSALDGPAFTATLRLIQRGDEQKSLPISVQEELRKSLLNWRSSIVPAARSTPDPRLQEEMRAHGYWNSP